MVGFQQRNPATIGLIGFAIIAALLFVAFRADRLPIIGGGDIYYADFAEVGGLANGDEVRIAGITVGKVEDTTLIGNKVAVKMRIKTDARLGTKTAASVRLRTLLGATYVGIDPEGPGELKVGSHIPLGRTTAPYDVVAAFSDLSHTTAELDLPHVAKAIAIVGDLANATPREFSSAINGLSDVSQTLASRDDQINVLLNSLTRASAVLDSHSTQIEALLKDSDELFAAVAARRASIHNLLVSAQDIGAQLSALVKSSRADLKPALDRLTKITQLLKANQAALDESLRLSPTFYSAFADTLGSGPWFDVYAKLGLGG